MDIRLFTSLMTWPLPISPAWKTFRLMVFSTGRMRAYCASVAPTMMAMVPAWAPAIPPLTGASMSSTPSSASSPAMRRVSFGSPVVWSMIMVPARNPPTSPALPKMTSRTWTEVGKQRKIRSQAAARVARSLRRRGPLAGHPLNRRGRLIVDH